MTQACLLAVMHLKKKKNPLLFLLNFSVAFLVMLHVSSADASVPRGQAFHVVIDFMHSLLRAFSSAITEKWFLIEMFLGIYKYAFPFHVFIH